MSNSLRIGLIGCGNAGQAMALALSGHFALRVYDRDETQSRKLADAVEGPIEMASDSASLARACDIVLLSLPTPDASLSVARDIRGAMRPGTVVLETSTVRPEDVAALHELLAPAGAMVIDSAIVGGIAALAQGRSAFLVGASEAEAGTAATVLEKLADDIFWLGARGKGMAAKLTVNAVAHAVYVVLVEAGALAVAQDIPLDVLQRLLERDSGLMRPLTHRFGDRLRHHDFAGGMSSTNAAKDSRLAQEAAAALGVPLYTIPAAHEVYELAIKQGLAGLDYAAIGRLWEERLGIDFSRAGAPPDARD